MSSDAPADAGPAPEVPEATTATATAAAGTDASADAAALTDKELRRKQKVEEQTNKVRRKALEEARQKASSRKTEAAHEAEDDTTAAEMTEEQKTLLAKLKELPKTGRLPDSLPAPVDGLPRRLTQLELDLARRLADGKGDDALHALYKRFADDRTQAEDEIAKLRTASVEAWRGKAFKGKTGADLEARMAKQEGKARKLLKTVQKQFIVLSKAATATLQNLEQADEFVKIGMFQLDKGDDANKDTFLHCAARDGEAEIAAWLLNRGASPNATNDQGDTPAHLAITAVAAGDKPGAWATLWHLIERGADLTIRNLAGKTVADVAQEQGPPIEVWAMANLIALAHAALESVADQLPFPLPGKAEKPTAVLMPALPKTEVQRLGLKDWKARQILEANQRREEEAARAAAEEESARKAAEEAEERRKELLQLKKASKILQKNLEELFQNIPRESSARAIVELLCAPPHLRTIREKLIDVSSPPAAEAAGRKCTPLHLAVLHFKPMLAEALLAAEADATAVDASQATALHFAARQLADAHAGIGLAAPAAAPADDDAAAEAEGEGDDKKAAKDEEEDTAIAFKLTVPAAQELMVKLLEAGAPRDARDSEGRTAADLLPTDELKAWLTGVQVRTELFDEGRKNRILSGLLQLLEATRSAEEQQRAAEAQARVDAKRRAVELRKQRALEEAKRKQEEEMTAALLVAAEAQRRMEEIEKEREAADLARKEKDRKFEEDMAEARRVEEEQRKREEEEKALADAQLAARLEQGKISQEQKAVAEAQANQRRLEAEVAAEAARADAALKAKLEAAARGGRWPISGPETPEQARQRTKIEGEEAAEDLEIAKMYDGSFDSIFTSLDLTASHPTKDQVDALNVHLTDFTKRQMLKLGHELKYFRKGVIGLAVGAYDALQSYETLWEQVKSLDELIDASIGETKTYKKAMSQTGFYTARITREAQRRIQVLAVNQNIYEDLMNKIVNDPAAKKKLMADAKAAGDLGRFNKFWSKLPDMAKNRALAEEAEIDDLFDPVLSEAAGGALLSTLLGIISTPLREMDAAMSKLSEDAQDELPLDLNLADRLEQPSAREWGTLGYAKRQMNFTDGLVRDLRAQKMELEKHLAGEGLPDASRKKFEAMLDEIKGQLQPLDTQHNMYEAIIQAINDHQKEQFQHMTPNEQLMFERKRAKEEAKLDEYFRKQAEDAQNALDAKGKVPNKTDSLIDKVLRDHKDDWTEKVTDTKTLLKPVTDDLIDDFGGDLDINWMTNRFGDLSGIDHDIIEDLKLLTETQAAHYLAIKMAENEADATFARLLEAKAAQAALTVPEQMRLADYSAFLDRRYPMYDRLYHVLESGPQGEAKYVQFATLDVERERTQDLFLAKRIQDAKIDMLDWRDVREQCAADTFCAAMAKLGGMTRPSLAVGADGVVTDDGIELSEDVLSQLHRNLHAQCCVSQDVVYMIINTVADGKVTRKNLVKSLHALHVACTRDTNVYWDSQVMFPTTGAFGIFTRDQAELVFGFNDHDVGTAYYDKFIKALQMATEKAERAEQAAGIVPFPADIFSRRALGLGHGTSGAEFYGAGEVNEHAMTPGVSVLPVDRLALAPGKDLFISAEELVGSKKKDAVVDEDGNVLKPGAERAARIRVGYWDMRHHLVAAPDVHLYSPTGWSY